MPSPTPRELSPEAREQAALARERIEENRRERFRRANNGRIPPRTPKHIAKMFNILKKPKRIVVHGD